MWQIGDFGLNVLCPGIQSDEGTNVVNFERSTLQVNREAGNATIKVYRNYVGGGRFAFGLTDYTTASTIYYTIDAANAFDDWNTFNLQSGSDYAIPDLATKTVPEGVVDFTSGTWGSVTFPAGAGNASSVQTITIPINTNNTVEFNKDFLISFDEDGGHIWNGEAIPGEIASYVRCIDDSF